ncbi:MAG: peptidase S8 [Bacteroidetes bacterium]|nr:MAG: peptidase S8 [Bacteroidota bacterium]
MNKITLLAALAFSASVAFAQKQAPQNWFHLDPKQDKYNGVSSDRTYNELLKGKQGKTVIVAVIDGGTEVNHEDLKQVIWVNQKEIPGNGIDDDYNGYTDDINGWNFIGGAEKNVAEDNLEVTRLYKELSTKFKNGDTVGLEGKEKESYELYKKVKAEYLKNFNQYTMLKGVYSSLSKGLKGLGAKIGKDEVTAEDLKAYQTTDASENMAIQAILRAVKGKKNAKIKISEVAKQIDGGKEQISKFVDFHYNTELDARSVVGDNYENVNERYYGNNRVSSPNGEHGTHVAGIIAAIRNNNIGMNGVADQVKIMVLRVVPDGDERDKDVANAIKYAVDNGASVINMSFGKSFSPNKGIVDEAVRYALSKDVLLVHGAGNDSKDIDVENNFPNKKMDSYTGENWLEVGASSWQKKKQIPAVFSNFGASNVDVFAPGVDIYSCIPESNYASYDGTSMASPVTAGVAAVIRSYFPHLKAGQVKEIIKKSAIPVKRKVYVPGTKKKVKMKQLCDAGGIVNLYEAVKLAETYPKK